MNRFTKDMATIDDMLPLVLFDLIQVGGTCSGDQPPQKPSSCLKASDWLRTRQHFLQPCSVCCEENHKNNSSQGSTCLTPPEAFQ